MGGVVRGGGDSDIVAPHERDAQGWFAACCCCCQLVSPCDFEEEAPERVEAPGEDLIAVGVCDSGKVREEVVGNAVDVGDGGVARNIGEDDVVVVGAGVVSVEEEVVVDTGRQRVCCWG